MRFRLISTSLFTLVHSLSTVLSVRNAPPTHPQRPAFTAHPYPHPEISHIIEGQHDPTFHPQTHRQVTHIDGTRSLELSHGRWTPAAHDARRPRGPPTRPTSPSSGSSTSTIFNHVPSIHRTSKVSIHQDLPIMMVHSPGTRNSVIHLLGRPLQEGRDRALHVRGGGVTTAVVYDPERHRVRHIREAVGQERRHHFYVDHKREGQNPGELPLKEGVYGGGEFSVLDRAASVVGSNGPR